VGVRFKSWLGRLQQMAVVPGLITHHGLQRVLIEGLRFAAMEMSHASF